MFWTEIANFQDVCNLFCEFLYEDYIGEDHCCILILHKI
jgi:hypothetical protein